MLLFFDFQPTSPTCCNLWIEQYFALSKLHGSSFFVNTPGHTVGLFHSKKNFPGLLRKLYAMSFTEHQLKAGFRACGIVPFNRNAVPVQELQPSPFVCQASPNTSATVTSETVTASVSSDSDRDLCLPSTSTFAATATTTMDTGMALVQPETFPQTATSINSASTSVRDFFLQRLTPRSTNNVRGRGGASRLQRFRYGESLTSDECLARMQKEKGTTHARGRGRGKGKAKSTNSQPSLRETASPASSSSSEEDNTPCNKCKQTGGSRWISCDLCDKWYHMNCVGLHCTPQAMEQEEWFCSDCSD